MQSVQKGTAAEKAGIRGGNVSTQHRRRPGRRRRRHHRLGRTARRSPAPKNSRPRSPPTEAGRDGEDRAQARERQRRLRKQDRDRDARRPSQLGPEPQHARRLGQALRRAGLAQGEASRRAGLPTRRRAALSAPLPLGPCRSATNRREDLRDHQPRRRRAGRRAGRVGGGDDLLRAEPAPLLARARRAVICAQLRRRVELCGVFVNAPLDEVVGDHRGARADAAAAARRRGARRSAPSWPAGPARA